jgi:uncharacterized NAD-dependent epimerase/dehydratase family protein
MSPVLRVPTAGRRFAVLVEGARGPMEAKTATALARYRPECLAALVHTGRAGATSGELLGAGGDAPVVADLEGARAAGANAVLVGVAPAGGRVPEAWRPLLLAALARGWEAWSGMHELLADDPEMVAAARASGTALVDLRRVPEGIPVAAARAARVRARVVLTVGSDCNVGKMTAAWEIAAELARRGERAAFAATGQTGILIAGWGIAVDRCAADFIAGAAEALVLEGARDADWVIVEGQGSLVHPGFSGVALGLLHGSVPAGLVLCHHAGRATLRHTDGLPVPPLLRLVALNEEAAGWVRPARVEAVALNTYGLERAAARRALAEAGAETGLPAGDVFAGGAGALVDALMAARGRAPAGGDAA